MEEEIKQPNSVFENNLCNTVGAISKTKYVDDVLKDPNLIQLILDEVSKSFQGEEDTIIALTISIFTRLVSNASAESKNIVLSESSGAGKDRLVKALCNILLEPEISYIHRNKLSPEVFNYWHNKDKEWTWDGKVLHIEDPTDELINSQGFKIMASGDKRGTVTKDQKALDIDIEGKPNMVVTTFTNSTEDEMIRRFPFIHLDTSEELTKKVMTETAKTYSGENKNQPDITLANARRHLIAYKVKVPFASQLVEFFPQDLVMRTYFKRFLDYICASAVLHQGQRENLGDGTLVATLDDYDLARITFMKTISNKAMIPLNRTQENLLKVLKEYRQPMFISDIRKHISKDKTWIYNTLDYFKEYGLVKEDTAWKPDANKEVSTFEVVEWLYGGCILPPTERLFGCGGCLGSVSLEKIDIKRKQLGLPPKYEIYYNNSHTSTTTTTTTTTTHIDQQLQPNYNQPQPTDKAYNGNLKV